MPYITYYVEVWRNAHKAKTNSVFMLQKKADYCEPTNELFINLHAFKCSDLVDRSGDEVLKYMERVLKRSYKVFQGSYSFSKVKFKHFSRCIFKLLKHITVVSEN